MVTGSSDSEISCHDIRVKQSLVRTLMGHEGEITNLQLTSDGKLISTSEQDRLLAQWDNYLTEPRGLSVVLDSPVGSISYKRGLLATTQKDVVSLWQGSELVHAIRCSSDINSVLWSQNSEEFVTTHSEPNYEVKLWQVDKTNIGKGEYWFTRVKQFHDTHEDAYITSCLSPTGEHLCNLSRDETISVFRLWPKAVSPAQRLATFTVR